MSTRTFTITFTRIELTWLYRQLQGGLDRAEGIIKQLDGFAIENKPLTDEQKDMLAEAHRHREELGRITIAIKDRLDAGERERLQLVNVKADLQEALTLVEEDSAKEEINKRLENLPKEETYRLEFDRGTCKFTLKLVENDLHKFRSQIIPNYEKAEAEEFTDPIQTKSYWVNKARQSKTILEQLKIKLEKAL